jgi:hypothetical protein
VGQLDFTPQHKNKKTSRYEEAWGSGGRVPPLTSAMDAGECLSFTPTPIYGQENNPVRIRYEAERASEPVWTLCTR